MTATKYLRYDLISVLSPLAIATEVYLRSIFNPTFLGTIVRYMIYPSHLRPVYTATRISVPYLAPIAATQYRLASAEIDQQVFSLVQRSMANLKTEIPNLKLNDGTSVPMVSTLLNFSWAQGVDNTT